MIEVQEREVRQRVDLLVEQGSLAAALRLLVAHRLFADASALLDLHAVRLVSQARYRDVTQVVEALPPAHRSLIARVADIDARRHEAAVDSVDIEQVIGEAQAAGRAEVKAWACAILVEHLLLEGDLNCVVLAAQYLAELPEGPMPPVLMLQARGRLRRILALAYLASGPAHEQLANQELQRAASDCQRASWHTDRWVSISLFYLFSVAVGWSAPPHVVHALGEARDQLLALGSSQVHFARYAVALAAYSNGDRTALRQELTELLRMGLVDDPAAMPELAASLDAICEAVLGGRPEAIERLGNGAGIRSSMPSMLGAMLVKAAHALLDLGRPDEAAGWHGRLIATPPILPYEAAERVVLVNRLALLRGDFAAVPRLIAALDEVAAVSYPRVTGGLTLRAAMDAARVGLPDVAAALRERAEAVLPPVAERNAWERFWLRGSQQQGTGGSITRSLRLLTPSVEVIVDGQPRRLAPNVARLLVALAALGRAVGTEELGDLLWGDVDSVRARGRLKSALHRLRQALSLDIDELVVRDGDVVRLVADPRWAIDLHDFHRFAVGDVEQRLRAFRMVDGLLCNAQFPYDDALAQERAVLEARWSALAAGLVASGAIEQHEVRRRSQRLGIVQ